MVFISRIKRVFYKENWILIFIFPLFLLFFKIATISLRLPVNVTPLWPPAGLTLAAALVYKKRVFLPIFLGIIVSHLLIFPVKLSFLPFSILINSGIPFLAIWLNEILLKKVDVLEENLNGFKKLLILGIITSLVSGFAGSTGMCLTSMEAWPRFFHAWLIWALGDFLGILVCAPALLRIFLLLRKHLQIREPLPTTMDTEKIFWTGMVLTIFTILPYTSYWDMHYLFAMGLVLLSILLWSALRFPPVFSNFGIMASLLAIWTLIGLHTPGFPYPETMSEIINLLLFSALVTFFPLFISVSTQQSRLLQKRLFHQAEHDSLTGLLNRRGFEERVVNFLEKANGPISAGMVFLNMDRLKLINDSCGHLAGDQLLEQIAFFLQSQFKGHSFIGRFSGDIFSIFLHHIDENQLQDQLEKLRQRIQEYRFFWEGEAFSVSVSIGSVYLITPRSFSILLTKADMACHLAKEGGGNRVVLLNVEDQTLDQKRQRWSLFGKIEKALKENEFVLFAQPIIPLQRGNNPKHYEILLRMKDKERGIIPPDEFLPIAEQNHLMRSIDYWVADQTLSFLESHPQAMRGGTSYTINLSGQSLNSSSFQDQLFNRISQSSVSGSHLCFEITESATIQNLKMAKRFINRIKSFHCSFALDDFGKGFSSFSYIKNLPIDYIKIDGSFIRDSFDSEVDQVMIKAVAEIASSLGLKTIAEFVCSEELNELMTYLKIDYGQGSFLGNPDYLNHVLISDTQN